MAYRKQTIQDKVSSYIKAGVSVTPQAQSDIARMNVIKSNALNDVLQLTRQSGDLTEYFGLFKPGDKVIFSLTGKYLSEEQIKWAVATHCILTNDGLMLKRTKKDDDGLICLMKFTSNKAGSSRKLVFRRSGLGWFVITKNIEDPDNTPFLIKSKLWQPRCFPTS